jgi:hypothetical protein
MKLGKTAKGKDDLMHRRARKRVGRWEVTDQNPPGSQQRSCSDAYKQFNS